MKTRLLIVISTIIVFSIISFAVPNLSKVYGSCEMTQDGELQFAIGYQWTNGLLYIDNAECTWKLFGAIPIASIMSENETPVLEDKQLKSIFANCKCQESGGPCIQPLFRWSNDTHYNDNNFCKFVQQPDICTQDMMSFINHHSNMFEGNEPLAWTFRGSDSIVESDQFEECRNELLKINKK
ncbi:MAG: hypothetical protein ACW9W3_05715 [Candidatus Nitrosopumilus sp. bin_68KS]